MNRCTARRTYNQQRLKPADPTHVTCPAGPTVPLFRAAFAHRAVGSDRARTGGTGQSTDAPLRPANPAAAASEGGSE
jgi:hypothetical protein